MVDSGATANFINSSVVEREKLEKTELNFPKELKVVDGRDIKSGYVTHAIRTNLRNFQHAEDISLLVADIGRFDIILGMPWLKKHNPSIDWEKKTVDYISYKCKKNCLPAPSVSVSASVSAWVSAERAHAARMSSHSR